MISKFTVDDAIVQILRLLFSVAEHQPTLPSKIMDRCVDDKADADEN